MKKIMSFLLSVVIFLGLNIPVFSAEIITIYADGEIVVFSDVAPVRENGILMVPVRPLFEAMGANVDWIQAENAVTIELYEQTAKFIIGSDTIAVNDKQIRLPVKTYSKNGRAMIPLSAFTEAFGCTTVNETTISSYIIKAKALINSFSTADTSVAAELLTGEYIQHNLAFGTGRDAFIRAVESLGSASAKTTVSNIRAFSDGNYVFLHSIYNFAGSGEQVAFDVFRFENGKIAEHWDNLAGKAKPNPSGHTQTDGTTTIKDLDKTEENKGLVMNFIEDILMGKNLAALTSYYNGNNYIQHNPDIADGLDGLGTALEAWATQGITMAYDKTYLLLGNGNFVLTASEGTLGGVKTVFYDLFRVENGYIAEHWDIIEAIPDKTDWANQNGKFGVGNTGNIPLPRTYHLGIGSTQVYNFGDIKLHAYKTNDYIDNENFILETKDELILIELVCFYDNISELKEYIDGIGKPLNSIIVAYHPAGGDAFPDTHMYASEGLGEAALVPGFVEAFGEIFNGSLPVEYELVNPGEMTIGGVKFNVIETNDAFDLEIPAINVYITHMVGSNTHNILTGIEHIDSMIAEMKNFQTKNYSFILSGHDIPRTVSVAAEKIAYLEKTKEIIHLCSSANEFISEMNKAFPAYNGVNYLEMSAGMIYGG